jgi:hypothetical protein
VTLSETPPSPAGSVPISVVKAVKDPEDELDEKYVTEMDPLAPEAGQEDENCVLQAFPLHAADEPALKSPTTEGRQKLPVQHEHWQSLDDEDAMHVAEVNALTMLEVATVHELTPDTV